jgi:hypothetical protein
MKVILSLTLFFFSQISLAKLLETKCTNGDCFKYGWVTTEPGTDYVLNCTCTSNDCKKFGWKSIDNRNSSYTVNCKSAGCFAEGWTSLQNDNGKILIDVVHCKDSSCLSKGWNIVSTYDKGGEVTCKSDDCSRFGGISFWRGKVSETSCYADDCYKNGWAARIEE